MNLFYLKSDASRDSHFNLVQFSKLDFFVKNRYTYIFNSLFVYTHIYFLCPVLINFVYINSIMVSIMNILFAFILVKGVHLLGNRRSKTASFNKHDSLEVFFLLFFMYDQSVSTLHDGKQSRIQNL